MHHNSVRDTTHELLQEVRKDVKIEPAFQPVKKVKNSRMVQILQMELAWMSALFVSGCHLIGHFSTLRL